ncbi:MAG: AAA family ATPase [Steroidobacter sp.]
MELLERDELLGTLQTLRQRAIAGDGTLLLLEGEAGIGKTSLLKTFCRQQRDVPIHWGDCDPLQIPPPLAPIHEIAAGMGGELQQALSTGAGRIQLFGAFLGAIAKPAVVVIEDLHWADDATLDFLRHVGRRIERTHTLLIGSFRNDEVGADHPLRMVLGDLATYGARHLMLAPLSIAALKLLIGERNIDAAVLHAATGGNPFFATEVLAAGAGAAPPTARDAVLRRTSRLGSSARAVLDAVAVAGPRVESWVLKILVENGAVDECIAEGVLCAQDDAFVFRHELARQAVMDEITPTRLLNLHRLTLQALESHPGSGNELARLADHAESAAAEEAVLKFAPAAAREAATNGSHRLAAQQFARALRFATVPTAQRAALLDDYASECQLSELMSEAVEALQSAAKLWRDLGDGQRLAMSLARLAHALVVLDRNIEGEAIMREAVELVGSETSTGAAMVYRWAAHLRLLDREPQEAIALSELGLRAAEQQGDQESIVHCYNTIGTAMILDGRVDAGRAQLEQSRALAQNIDSDAWVANAFVSLGSMCGEVYRFDLADHYLRRGIEFCSERDIDSARLYQLSWQALVWMYRGRWTEVSGVAHVVLADRRAPVIARITALIALGRVRARRGELGVWEALNEAKDLAGNSKALPLIASLRAARAEAAWFEGRTADAAIEASVGLELVLRKRHPWFAAELLFWCWQSDGSLPGGLPDFCSRLPFALEITGRGPEAAAAWRELNCSFESARALGEGDESAQREALVIFESFSARPMIERVRHKLSAMCRRGPKRPSRP